MVSPYVSGNLVWRARSAYNTRIAVFVAQRTMHRITSSPCKVNAKHSVFGLHLYVLMSAFFPDLPNWVIGPPFAAFVMLSMILLWLSVRDIARLQA